MKHYGMRRMVCLLVAGLFVLSGTLAIAADEKLPWDGIVEFSSGSIAAGIGFSWGSGTLTYQGKQYPFKIDGMSLGNVGIQSSKAWGKVYNLKDVNDLSGTYVGLSAGVTVIAGGSAKAMKNQKGVIIDVYSNTEGADLQLATNGVKIKLQ